jgi:folate-dependent phosphoribosylglycinamide formyltransferase PurN
MRLHFSGRAIAGNGGRIRIVLLRSDDPQHSYLEARIAHELNLLGVVIEPGRRERARLLGRRQWSAWLWREYHCARQRLTGRAAYRRRYFSDATAAVSESSSGYGTEQITVDWINCREVREFLDRLQPDLLLVCGTQYIRQEILASGPIAINIHGGYLPYYKGNHGVFFAFEQSDFIHIGVSLHIMSAKLDAGPLLAVVRPDMFPHDNDEHLYCQAFERAVDLLCRIIGDLEAGLSVKFWEQPHAGRTFRHRDRSPSRELRLWALRRLGMRRAPRLDGSEILPP